MSATNDPAPTTFHMAEQHPLYGATLRVDRAAKHIQELRDVVQAWTDMHPDLVEGVELKEDGKLEFRPKLPLTMEPLANASVAIGDALYNLRAALDYTVYAIAVSNNNWRHVSGTQFPIEVKPEWFDARVTGKHPDDSKKTVKQHLKCVPPSAVMKIRLLQPFAGNRWTGALQELSNPDKHRTVTGLSSRSHFRADKIEQSEEGKPEIYGNFEVQIFFRDTDTDAVDTLQLFEREVRAVVDAFKPSFKIRAV